MLDRSLLAQHDTSGSRRRGRVQIAIELFRERLEARLEDQRFTLSYANAGVPRLPARWRPGRSCSCSTSQQPG